MITLYTVSQFKYNIMYTRDKDILLKSIPYFT